MDDAGPKLEPNKYLCGKIVSEATAVYGNDHINDCTHLYSHYNMIVVCKHCLIIGHSNYKAHINYFSNELGALEDIPIVDAIILYEDLYITQIYFLVVRNTLYFESMTHNLISLFIMREAGLEVNDRAKIHCRNRTRDDHCLKDPRSGMYIRLNIEVILSVFDSRESTDDDLRRDDIISVEISPQGSYWDPNSTHYSENEEALVDVSGEVIDAPEREPGELFVETVNEEE